MESTYHDRSEPSACLESPAMSLLYSLEVRMDRERQEFKQQIQRLEEMLGATPKDSLQYETVSDRRAEWWQLSGRLDAFQSVLANHGARLLEGEAHLQAVAEHLGLQGVQWPTESSSDSDGRLSAVETTSPVKLRSCPSIPSDAGRGGEAGVEIQHQLQDLQRSQDAMAESLRESKGSFNATLGDMKALWREVASLQQGDVPHVPPSWESLREMQQEVQSLKLMLESHVEDTRGRPAFHDSPAELESRWTPESCRREIEQLKKQLHVVERLILAYRDALSDMTGRLKEALAEQKRPPSPHFGQLSLAAHARRQASAERAWPPTTQGMKLLLENVLQFVEELHTRVRHVEDASFAKDLAEVKHQMEVLQGETLMSFHQLQQAVADLNCVVEAKSLQHLSSRVEQLEAMPQQSGQSSIEAKSLQDLSSRLERLEAMPQQSGQSSIEAQSLLDLSRIQERLEAKSLQDLSSRLERLEAMPQQQSISSIEAESLRDLSSRLERLEANKSLQHLSSRLELFEGSVSTQLDQVKKEEDSHRKLLNRLDSLEVTAAESAPAAEQLQERVQRIEASKADAESELRSLNSRLDRLDKDFARQHARLEDLEQERKEGQMLEEVLQDKVSRIEHLEAAVKGDVRSIASVKDEASKLRSLLEEGKQEHTELEKQLAALEGWRRGDAQVLLSRCELQIQKWNITAEDVGRCRDLIAQVSSRMDRLQEVVTQTEVLVKAKADSEDLARLKLELGRLAERSAEKGEVSEVSRGMQSSLASAQESMNSIKEELLQVQRLAGARDGSRRDVQTGSVSQKEVTAQAGEVPPKRPQLTPGEPSTWWTTGPGVRNASQRIAVNDVARLAEELHQARSAAMHQTRMEVHRAEAMGALESQVAALNLRLEDVFARLSEVELGIDTTSRGGVALRLRFEQMQSSVELRLSSLSAELADVRCVYPRRARNEHEVQVVSAREPLQVDLWERCERLRQR